MLAHRLIFIRHGETDWNAERRLQGHQDVPLNQRGVWQAGEAGRRALAMLGPAGVRSPALKFIASPLMRTVHTMRLARTAMGLPEDGYDTDARLKELTFGEWEGLTWPQVQARAPESARWRDGDKWNFIPPGGESYAMLAARLEPWLAEVSSDAVVVSHGGVARALMAMIGGLEPQRAALADVWQGRVLVFHKDRFDWV